MLEIARLTMTGPKTLLLDEPSVGLMPPLVDEVYEEIGRLKQERSTILIVDQNVTKAISIPAYVYALALGENRYEGQREDGKSVVKVQSGSVRVDRGGRRKM